MILAAAPLSFLECLQLPRDDALVTVRSNPTDVPLIEPGDLVPVRAVLLVGFSQGNLVRGLFGNVLLQVRQVRVIVVAHRANGQATRAIAERADDAQKPLPEAEQLA